VRIYRGVSKYYRVCTLENEYLKTPRLPRNVSVNVHNVADKWFYNKFGIKARSECIFCTPCIEQAKEFGRPYEVSLAEGLEYVLVYSINVEDFIEIEFDIRDVSDDNEIILWLENKSYESVRSLEELPKGFQGEIMLYCEKYKISEV
tara:strand:- start:1407 stop:1847 length:441 start_codon:yes stop_codon:yes gene_type:complete